MSIEGSVFMVGDADAPFSAPSPPSGASVGLDVYVDNVDQLGDRAARAGAEVLQEPTDMFYGDRSVMLRDPFGHVWAFLKHVEDLTPTEIEQRGISDRPQRRGGRESRSDAERLEDIRAAISRCIPCRHTSCSCLSARP
jgi:hypothetical protein